MNDKSPQTQLKRKQAKYASRRERGLCGYGVCGAPAEPGRSKCKKHLKLISAKAGEKRAERIDHGLCTACGIRPKFWGRKCMVCRQRSTTDQLPKEARRAVRLFLDEEVKRREKSRDVKLRASAKQLLASLNLGDREQRAIALYLGLDGKRRRTYQQVGKLMRISPERVRQLILPAKLILDGSLGAAPVKSTVYRKLAQPYQRNHEAHTCSECGRPYDLV